MAEDKPALLPGEERYKMLYPAYGKKCIVQYEYRHINGTAFDCMGKSLEDCRAKRDAWLSKME